MQEDYHENGYGKYHFNEGEIMIFVTVGNGEFDAMTEEVDHLKAQDIIKEKIVLQIGHGKYIPKHCEWFKFQPSLEQYYDQADLIISHGGPGVVFEVLRKKKKLIALPNRERTDPNHQVEYLKAIAEESSALLYCDNVSELKECIKKAKTYHFAIYREPSCSIHTVISQFLSRRDRTDNYK